MAGNDSNLAVRTLETVEGSITIRRQKSAKQAIILTNLKSRAFIVYGKANAFNTTDAKVDKVNLEDADLLSMEHDFRRLEYALVEWTLPEDAFSYAPEDMTTPNREALENLKEDVFVEINKTVNEYWGGGIDGSGKLSADEIKEKEGNLIEPSTNSLSQV